MRKLLDPEQASVRLESAGASLDGFLAVPDAAKGLVIFAHGSGSGRHSPRNRFVARELNRAGIGTLLLDLLTDEEEEAERLTGELRFNIRFLADRLLGAAEWAADRPETRDLPVGLFGASTGAAAALVAAAERSSEVWAVVSRGGRPDLAWDALPKVKASVLLIVGGHDTEVLELNRRAALRLHAAHHHLEVVSGATHLFPEPGAIEEVARLAAGWFQRFLKPFKEGRP